MHGAVKANGASWIWRGRPDDHPLAVAKRRRDRERELQRERQLFERLVVLTAKILDRGEPTRFRFEANCKYALRIDFIIEGRSWALSDFMAGEVLRHAFASLNVMRPSWYEAQPEYRRLKTNVYCANEECGKPIERTSKQAILYCSEDCRLAAKWRRHQELRREEQAIYAQAKRDAKRAQAEPRACQWCGGLFRPYDVNAKGRAPQKFCSIVCRSRYGRAPGGRPAELSA